MLTIEEDRMYMAPANGSSEFEGFVVIVNQPDRQCDNPNYFQLLVALWPSNETSDGITRARPVVDYT